MLQATDPERLSNKEASRGMLESSWEGKIEEITRVYWGHESMEVGGVKWVWSDGGSEY